VLRIALIALSALVLMAATALIVIGRAVPGIGVAALWALLLLAGTLLERRRYKRLLAEPPGAEWAPTSERFIDPATGAEVLVYFNGRTGARAYVRIGASPPGI
jgi:hypothetical protein